MKTRLPKTLLVALMAAASYTAQAGYYQIGATFGTDLSDGTYKAEDIPCTSGRYAPTAKDGDCTLTIDGWVDNSIYVREGKVIVKDNDLTLSGYREMEGKGYVAMTVSGKNPELEVNGATLKLWAWSSAFHVGGLDGSGSLVVKNGGKFINEAGFSTWIGYSSHEEMEIGSIGFMNGHATTETTTGDVTKTTDRYKGTYYSGSSNPEFTFGRGSVLVTGNSYMNAGGMGALYIAEGVLTVEDNSKLESGNNPMHGVHVAEWGYKEGSTSVVNVTKNSEILMHQYLMTSSNSPDAKTFITVDDSTFTVKLGLYLSTVPEVANTYSELILKNGSTGDFGEVYAGAGSSVEGEGLAYIGIDKTSQLITSKIKANRGSQFDNKGDVKVGKLLLNGGSFDNYGTITADSVSLNSGVLNNAGTLNVKAQLEIAKAATLNCLAGSTISGVMPTGCTYAFTLSAKNLSVAGTTLAAGTEYSTSAPLTLKLAASENLYAGKYMLLDATQGIQTNRAATPAEVESVTGLGAKKEDIVWEDSILYYYLGENLVVAHDPLADAVQAANWGVYHSSQAFTSMLWAPHTNAVKLTSPGTDEKGVALPTQPVGYTLAWASVYSSFAEHCGSNGFADMDYSIVGGAVGVEHRCAGGSSIGIAFGYDWGKASPKGLNNVDQESMHAALYGRAFETGVSQNGKLALDWSAAVGQTESDHKLACCDWTQNSMQLDARLSYIHAVSERTAVNAFVGMQYYAQDDDSTDRIEADSMQNLRAQFGVGVSHQVCEKAVVFAEASVYRDIMRHNPEVNVDGFYYGSGANPGRTGGNITVGAEYSLTPNWTLRGSYGFEVADHLQQHNANVGAVYSF